MKRCLTLTQTTIILRILIFFKGFDFDDEIEPVIEEDSKFLQLLKKLTVEKHVYEYFKQWIGHIIQFPHLKTNAAIVLYSDTKGIGKNCIVEGITRLFKGYTGKVESISYQSTRVSLHNNESFPIFCL